MSCKDVQKNIEAYLDNELTLSDRRGLEDHLQSCDQCQLLLDNLRGLSQSINKIGYASKPAGLRRNIKNGLRDISGEDGSTFGWPHLFGVGGASAVLASATVWLVMSTVLITPMQTQLSDELIDAHVRALMVDHMTDVTSSDRHTVKPWFNGRLDFAPVVQDVAEHGFPLVGGRLDYLHKQPAAALVYKRRAHIINLFIVNDTQRDQTGAVEQQRQRGYNLLSWQQDSLRYTLVSDLNNKELQELASHLGATSQ